MKSEEILIRKKSMAGMVSDLQQAASESSTGVSDLLRKVLLVARKLKIIDQTPWIQSELNGYADANPNSFPSYRFLGDDIKCYCESYLGTFVTIPSQLAEAGLDFYEKQLLRKLYGISVYEIERLLKYCTKNAEVSMPCPPCAEAAVKKLTGVPSPITLVFQEYSLTGILDAVRTRIREWAWKLEENGISGENLPFSDDPLQHSKADMLSIRESAEYAHVDERTIRNWLDRQNGDKGPMLPGVVRVGKRSIRIPRGSLEPWRK